MTTCEHCGGTATVRDSDRRRDGTTTRRLRCSFCGHTWLVPGMVVPWQHRGHRPVRCVETGQEFPSVAAAARAVFVTRESLRSSIARGYRAAGFRWAAA